MESAKAAIIAGLRCLEALASFTSVLKFKARCGRMYTHVFLGATARARSGWQVIAALQVLLFVYRYCCTFFKFEAPPLCDHIAFYRQAKDSRNFEGTLNPKQSIIVYLFLV